MTLIHIDVTVVSLTTSLSFVSLSLCVFVFGSLLQTIVMTIELKLVLLECADL